MQARIYGAYILGASEDKVNHEHERDRPVQFGKP